MKLGWRKILLVIHIFKRWTRGKKDTVWGKEERKSNKLWTLKQLWRFLKISFVDIESSNKNKCDISILLPVLKSVVIVASRFNVST